MQVIYIDRLGNIWREERKDLGSKPYKDTYCHLTNSRLPMGVALSRAREYYSKLSAPKAMIRQISEDEEIVLSTDLGEVDDE